MIFFPHFPFTRHCAKKPSTARQRECIVCHPCSHACVATRGRWRQTSYPMVLLLLYSPLSCIGRKEQNKTPKCVRFICTLCYIGTELYRKEQKSGAMTEKHAITNPFDSKSWRSVRKRRENRVQNKGLFQYLLHQNVDCSGGGCQFAFLARQTRAKVSGSSPPSVHITLPFLCW